MKTRELWLAQNLRKHGKNYYDILLCMKCAGNNVYNIFGSIEPKQLHENLKCFICEMGSVEKNEE